MKSFFGLILAIAVAARAAPTLHVAPDGNDRWTGRLAVPNAARTDGPLASLARARDLIRELPAPRGPVSVEVADGTYCLTSPLVFEPEDSGAPGADIVYRAAPGAHPIISGGVAVSGWRKMPSGIWSAPAPFRTTALWMEERRIPPTRLAGVQTAPASAISEAPWNHSSGRPYKDYGFWYDQAQVAVRFAQPDMVRALAALSTAGVQDSRLVCYHGWDVTRRFLDSVDPSGRSLTVHGQGLEPYNRWTAMKSRFFLENVPAELGAPGGWALTPRGDLSYRPFPREPGPPTGGIIPRIEKFIVFHGDSAGRTVGHLAFEGLSFRYAGWVMPRSGFDPEQAAADTGAVIEADGAHDLRFSRCAVEHISTYAFWLRRGCRDVAIEQCRLEDLGAGGVRIGEKDLRAADADRTGRVTVDNCIIRRGGRQFECAVGVWIGQSSDNRITHNEIADFYYTGVSVGWVWGYAPSGAARNEISYNHIHRIGQGLLSDLGGIYTLGVSPGTVCAHNVIHDVVSADYGANGLYLDEGSSGIVMRDNLVYRTQTDGVYQHYGEANVVENNIFFGSVRSQIRVSRAEPHLSLTFRHNIVSWSRGVLFRADSKWDGARLVRDHNLYFKTGPVPADFGGKSLAAWEASGHENGSLVADPRFMNPAGDDFRLRADSPALKLGFVPFDFGEAGVYGDPGWIELARGAETEF